MVIQTGVEFSRFTGSQGWNIRATASSQTFTSSCFSGFPFLPNPLVRFLILFRVFFTGDSPRTFWNHVFSQRPQSSTLMFQRVEMICLASLFKANCGSPLPLFLPALNTSFPTRSRFTPHPEVPICTAFIKDKESV